jgi:serine/threonine-protein kinase
MSKFFEELKRRNVIKATIAYLVVAWIIIQVAIAVLPTFGAPEWVTQAIIIILTIGLPIWIIISWIYDITPEGIAKTTEAPEKQIFKQIANKRLNVFLIVSLSIAVVVMGLKMSNVFEPSTDGKYSIAVMPFVNVSNDIEQEYFSDGISEEIINMLSQVPGLKVMARTSSFSFKGKNQDVKSIGKQLEVSHILEGSVRKSGNKLRITAQLINIEDGSQMFSEQFDRELKDIFDIQDEISANILKTIKIRLLGDKKEMVFKNYTENIEAYQLYLKGKYFYNQNTREGFLKAIDYFKQAIALDADYAIAYAGMSYCYHTLSFWSWMPSKQAMPLALEAGKKSIDLDDQISESLINLARKNFHYEWNARDARIALQKAVAINPNNPEVYIQLAFCAILSGNHDEAIAYANKAISLDPFSTMTLWMAGFTPLLLNENEIALEINKQLIDLNPDFFGGHLTAGQAYFKLGKFEEALYEHKIAISLENGPLTLSSLGLLYGFMGDTTKAKEIIEEIKNIEGVEVLEYNGFIADVYLGIGDWDTAFMHYNIAVDNREGNMIWKRTSYKDVPGFLEDPRAIALFEKMNIIY